MPTRKASERVSKQDNDTQNPAKRRKSGRVKNSERKRRSTGESVAISREKDAKKRGGVGGKGRCSNQATDGVEKKKKKVFGGQSQSCHQCRQSIHSNKGVSEVKSGRERLKCSTCTRFWCEQCLLNRYGIVKETVAVDTWSCPVCCKKCNCSLCRRKEGKLATGILTPLAKVAGFGSVSDFLTDGTDDIARILQWQSPRQPTYTGANGDTTNGLISSPKPSQKRQRQSLSLSLTHTSTTSPHHTLDEFQSSNINGVSCHGNRCKSAQLQPLNLLSLNGASTDSTVTLSMTPQTSPSQVSSLGSPPSITTSDISQQSSGTPSNVLVWRSPRQRTLTNRFTPEDFRGKSKSPSGDKCRKNHHGTREPSIKSPQGAGGVECDNKEWEIKHDELETLRKIQLENMRYDNDCHKQEESVRRGREREQRKQERHEIRQLAQEIARQSRDNASKKREHARQQRNEELKKLKQERMEWRRQIKDTTFLHTPLVSEVDMVISGNEQELAPLPDIPPLVLPIATSLISRLITVTEFLTTFSEILRLTTKPTAESLAVLLSSSHHGPVDIYKKLLQLVVAPDDKFRSKFKGRGLKWETLAGEYLGLTMTSSSDDVANYRLCLVELLVSEALTTTDIITAMELAMVSAEQVRIEGRTQLRQRTKSIRDDLKGLLTVEDIETKKTQVMDEIATIQRNTQDEMYGNMLLLRNSCLGEDRLGRRYWRLQCVPGVVVETGGCYGDDSFQDDKVEWLHITTQPLLSKLLTCLQSSGGPESQLLSQLHNIQHIIITITTT